MERALNFFCILLGFNKVGISAADSGPKVDCSESVQNDLLYWWDY